MRTKVQYDANGNKRCTKCGEFKDVSNFHKWSKGQDGLKLQCKACVREYDLAEDDPKRKMPRKYVDGKIHCRNCGEYFHEEGMAPANKGKYKGLTYCADCRPLLDHIRNVKSYGITIDEYHKMLEEQDYSCKICGLKESTYRKRLSIDHDHACCPGAKSCGKCVRGLICHHCNAGLGNAKDSVENFKKKC